MSKCMVETISELSDKLKKQSEIIAKLKEALELAIMGIHGVHVDVRFLLNKLKEYRGEK